MKTIKMENRIKMVIPILLIIAVLVSGSTTITPIAPQGLQASSTLVVLVPGTPGKEEKILEDSSSSSKASEKRATAGDNFLNGLYERPFTSKAMIYQPDVDIVKVDFASGATGTVTLASSELTLFSKATIGADVTYQPRGVAVISTGAAATNGASPVYVAMPMAGTVTCTVIGESAGVTNAYTVTAVYNK